MSFLLAVVNNWPLHLSQSTQTRNFNWTCSIKPSDESKL